MHMHVTEAMQVLMHQTCSAWTSFCLYQLAQITDLIKQSLLDRKTILGAAGAAGPAHCQCLQKKCSAWSKALPRRVMCVLYHSERRHPSCTLHHRHSLIT